MNPDALTDQLELFLDVLETGSFSAAARRHPLTPSAVARRIDALERAMGSSLFSRTVRIPRHPATQSALIWPGIPGPSGHLFHGHPAGQSERSDAGVALLVRVGWRRQFLRPFAH